LSFDERKRENAWRQEKNGDQQEENPRHGAGLTGY
jgi:hypothetical protein